MQKGEIMFRFFVPAHQDAPKVGHPRMGALDAPASGLLACCVFDCLGFLVTQLNRRSETKLLQDIAHFLRVVTFVQAHALPLLRRWHRVLDDDAAEQGILMLIPQIRFVSLGSLGIFVLFIFCTQSVASEIALHSGIKVNFGICQTDLEKTICTLAERLDALRENTPYWSGLFETYPACDAVLLV